MKNVFVLYDTGVCEAIRVCSSMERGITIAIKRLVFFGHDCLSFNYGDDFTVIEYRDHENQTMQALTITKTAYEED